MARPKEGSVGTLASLMGRGSLGLRRVIAWGIGGIPSRQRPSRRLTKGLPMGRAERDCGQFQGCRSDGAGHDLAL